VDPGQASQVQALSGAGGGYVGPSGFGIINRTGWHRGTALIALLVILDSAARSAAPSQSDTVRVGRSVALRFMTGLLRLDRRPGGYRRAGPPDTVQGEDNRRAKGNANAVDRHPPWHGHGCRKPGRLVAT
jgi:hypothetical protein